MISLVRSAALALVANNDPVSDQCSNVKRDLLCEAAVGCPLYLSLDKGVECPSVRQFTASV